jgi:hypothetical protein
MPWQQHLCKKLPKMHCDRVNFIWKSSVYWGYVLLQLSKPANFFTEKTRRLHNQLAPDRIPNSSSSYILHTRAQYVAHETMIKCLRLSWTTTNFTHPTAI